MSSNEAGPFVSVLMPTFNVQDYVEDAIQSVLCQTMRDFELIVQDDGSSDDTVAVVERLAALDARIILAPPFDRNRGVIAARNSLLERARGRYIAWMDSDDSVPPQRLATQLAYLEAHPDVGALGTSIEYADENMVPLRTERFSADPQQHAVDPQICCATVMARSDVVRKVGPFRDAFKPGGEDGDWILRIADHAKVTNIDDVLYTYRQHNSTSKRGAGAIRRLGVLARYAARVRREGRTDPIDAMQVDDGFNYLADSVFLDQADLSVTEKVTALSLPLPGHERLVSVLIPYYNAHRYFDQCLEHLARQTFRNFEVLIYDDGSGEPVNAERVAHLLGDIPFVLESGTTNRGVTFARNHLLGMTSAKLIAWQDADDYSRDIRLETQVRYLLEHSDCKAVGSAINYLKHSIVTRSESYPRYAFGDTGFSGCCASFMVRKQAVDAVGKFNDKFAKASEDVDFLSRIEPRTAVQNDHHILYYYRRHGSQLTERPDWVEAQAFYFMTRHLEEHGLAPIDAGISSAEEIRAKIDGFLRLRRARIDGTSLGEMCVRIVLRDIKARKRSPLALVSLAMRFPRSMARCVYAFVRHRGGMLLKQQFGGAKALARPWGDGSAAGSEAQSATAAPGFAPAVLTERPAPIVAQCLDNWGDLDDAITYLTPGGKGIWGDVAFVRKTSFAPDWHIVFNTPGALPVDISASPNRVIFAIGEPPTKVHRAIQEGQEQDTIVLTSDEELVALPNPRRQYVLTPAMTRAWSVKRTYDELRSSAVDEKPRKLSWVTSNLALLKGHRYRLQFLDKLRRNVEFDLFGRGFQSIDNKWDALAPYRYSIAFENTCSDYYFTEKLMDCFVAEAMPIYYGSRAITRFFPPESMVIFDPEDPFVFEQIKEVIASDLWQQRRAAIREAKYLVLEKYNTFAYLAGLMEKAADEPLPEREMRIQPVTVDFGADE